MADIRKCFSTVGDTTLTKWLDKGLIGCESDKKGIRTNISYSALELAHVGVLAQLSTWGVLNYYKDVKVDFGGPRQFLLTEPDRIIDHYCYNGPDLRMIVIARQVSVDQDNKRMRSSRTEFEIKILTPPDAQIWEQKCMEGYDPEGDPFALESFTVKTQHENPDIPEENMFFGFLKLHVGAVISHVYNKLDIEFLLR